MSLLTMMTARPQAATPPANPTWAELVESPTGVAHALMFGSSDFAVGDKIYVAKGWDGTNRRNEAQAFDTTTNAWQTLATDSGGVGTRYSSVAMHAGKLYIIGGESGSGTIADVRIYDTSADTWAGKAGIPSPRNAGACALDAVRGDVYLCGGRDAFGAYTATVYRYDIGSNSWSQTSGVNGATLPDLPVTAAFGQAFVSGSKLYCFPAWTGVIHGTMYVLDLSAATPSWSTAGTHPAPTAYATAYATDSSLYLYCGYNGTSWLNQGYRYDASTGTFVALNAMADGGVASGFMGLVGGRLYAAAGRSTTAYTQDVQVGT